MGRGLSVVNEKEKFSLVVCISAQQNVSIANQGWQRSMGICIVLC